MTVDRPQRWSKQKYAAKSGQIDHAKQLQRVYLRFLYAIKAVCSGVPEFAAYFRETPSGSAEKTRDLPTRPRFWPSATCGFVPKKGIVLCSFRFSPHFRKTMPCITNSSDNGGNRDNIQASLKRQRAIAGKPSNDPSLSSPHVESTTTVSLRESYRNVQEPSRAMIRNADVRPQFPSK